MIPPPVAIGLLACERIIVEEGTRNLSLINTFTRRQVGNFPSRPLEFVVFAALIGGRGAGRIRVELTRLETGEVLASWENTGSFTNPLTEMHLFLRVRDFSFPAAGRYQVMVLVDGEWIAHRHLDIFA